MTACEGGRIVAGGDTQSPRVFPPAEADGMQPSPDPPARLAPGAPTPPRAPLPAPAPAPRTGVITELLVAWGAGDRAALDALRPAVYGEPPRQARRALARGAAGHTRQPTALVREAYLRLVDQRRARWESRAQLFAVAARVMRRVLVDHARRRRAAKRGGGRAHVTLAALGVSPATVGRGWAVARLWLRRELAG